MQIMNIFPQTVKNHDFWNQFFKIYLLKTSKVYLSFLFCNVYYNIV